MEKKKLLIAYSNKSKHKSTAQYFIDAAKNLSIEFITLSENELCNGKLKKSYVHKIKKFKPDLIFYIEGGDHRFLPIELFNLDVPCISYLIDTHLKKNQHFHLSQLFDTNFLAQKKYISSKGIKNPKWLPLASENYKINSQKHRDIDISFIGSMDSKVHPERVKILNKLREDFSNIAVGEFPSSEIQNLYGRSKIVLNWSINNDLNMRIFEGLGAGAKIISNEISIDELIECKIENHVTIVKNYDELKSAINEYLNNYEKNIEQNAPTNIFYENRIETVIEEKPIRINDVSTDVLLAACFSIGNYQQVIYLLSRKDSYEDFGIKSNFIVVCLVYFAKTLNFINRIILS